MVAPKIIPDEINNELKNNSSITLVEIVLVLGFISLMFMGIFMMFDKVQKTQTNQKTEALIQMEENTNKFKEKLKNNNLPNNNI